MLGVFGGAFFRAGNQPIRREWRALLHRIEGLADSMREFDDTQLRKEALSLSYRARCGEKDEALLPHAFALVREAADRQLGMRHYPVQILGGIAIHSGAVAVMQTGEGKTLTATLPLYLAALRGKGAHLATANDYLAARDAELMRPVYEALGMRVGVVEAKTERPQRYQAYRADITYSTAKEIGFDFLRDRLALREIEERGMSDHTEGNWGTSDEQDLVQRDLNFMLVDEADSILIDEARTPLIISSLPQDADERRALFRWAAEVHKQFELDRDFEYDREKKAVYLSGSGRKLVRKLDKPQPLAGISLIDMYEQIELALLVHILYQRDRHYVVRNDEIVIVDEFTGRMAEGRKWRAGLHQAIEASEGLDVSLETAEAARITIQDLFLKYDRLSGMTGTVASSAAELNKIYQTPVVTIPTNRPPRRTANSDAVFGSSEQKWHAIVEEVREVHSVGRPVLVGTRSIDKSEHLSQLLEQAGLEHQVLNARHLEREAEIVAEAGRMGRITVATNMAGRGTDIRLEEESLQYGGLHVIISELHESARIDRQLIGRCGRQGDPGSYRFFMSLDDDILFSGFGRRVAERLIKLGERQKVFSPAMARVFRQAQARVEKKHFQGRKMLLYHEQQRQVTQREMGQDPYVDTFV